MAVELPSAQNLAQSLMRAMRDRRLKRRSYRYYNGYQRLDVSVVANELVLTTETDDEVLTLSVLHGRHIVHTAALAPIENQDDHASSDGSVLQAKVDLDVFLDSWISHCDFAKASGSVDVSDSNDALTDQDGNANESDSYAGTARFAFSFESNFEDLPSGIAWLQINSDGELLRRKDVRSLLDSGELTLSAPVIAHRIIGRFPVTDVDHETAYHSDNGTVQLYINKKAELAMAVNRSVTHKYRIRTDITEIQDGVLTLAGALETQSDRLESARLQLVGRRSNVDIMTQVEFEFDQQHAMKRFGRANYSWTVNLDFKDIDWSSIDRTDNYDLYLWVTSHGGEEPRRLRVTRTPFMVRKTTRAGAVTIGDETLAISPYFTFKAKSTSLILEVFDKDAFEVVAGSKERSFPIRKSQKKPIWIIGELPYKAQDNGLHLFKYLRNKRTDIDAYYVIDESSPDLRNFESLDHVVFHGSKDHFDLSIRAERFVGTHHADYLYPTRHQSFSSRCKATRVFLQHGVMGTKWMVPNYGKNSPGFTTDLFMVSSEREKQYIVEDFQYSPDEVKVTGLSRFDALLANDLAVKENMLLIIPTWRDWLQNEEVFLESDYLSQWRGLLKSPELASLAKSYDLEIVFCLHPNMMQFREHFSDTPARLIVQGEVDVQELIKTAAIMITDYSSVNFDFSFLHKPVHYYQFDRARFLGPNGSHLNLDEELPGRIAFDSAMLLGDLRQTLERGGVMEDRFRKRADNFITYRDRNNSARVTEVIEKAGLRSKANDSWKGELGGKVKSRFRRHRRYFNIMRKLFKVYKCLPMDENLIIFESGLGRQYADSPRYIYEELVRQGDTRRKVWVYSGGHRFTDPLTTTVKRLSPEYFWALARAKYWVSNQSFPHYLKRRARGIFLQTWHGTPLKQMARDIREVHGRDEGYLDRVTTATAQWTHLISPSTYTSKIMRSAYAFSGEAVELGYPRNDILNGVDVQTREKLVREALAIPENAKTVLYAPTFRDDAISRPGKFQFDIPMDLEEFDRRFGEGTILLLRMHVLVSNQISVPEHLSQRVIDVSGYPDIQELYLASDVLITDYSSVFFDYSLLRRPIIFYAYDLENYRDNLRGFYLDYERALPGPIVESESELWETVAEALTGAKLPGVDREEFIAKFAPYDDGYASQRVVERFFL